MSDGLKTRLLGLGFLLASAVLALINIREIDSEGQYWVKSSVLVPIAALLGLGMLIHGEAAAPRPVTVLFRAYGFMGTALAAVLMYRLGFLADLTSADPTSRALAYGLVLFTLAIWFLPKRYFES